MKTPSILAFVIALLFVVIGIQTYRVIKVSKKYEQELTDVKMINLKDSLEVQRIIRQKDNEAFRYRDSIRQLRIDYIKAQNEKSRSKTAREITILKSNPTTEYKDSIWSAGWNTQDSLEY